MKGEIRQIPKDKLITLDPLPQGTPIPAGIEVTTALPWFLHPILTLLLTDPKWENEPQMNADKR